VVSTHEVPGHVFIRVVWSFLDYRVQNCLDKLQDLVLLQIVLCILRNPMAFLNRCCCHFIILGFFDHELTCMIRIGKNNLVLVLFGFQHDIGGGDRLQNIDLQWVLRHSQLGKLEGSIMAYRRLSANAAGTNRNNRAVGKRTTFLLETHLHLYLKPSGKEN